MLHPQNKNPKRYGFYETYAKRREAAKKNSPANKNKENK